MYVRFFSHPVYDTDAEGGEYKQQNSPGVACRSGENIASETQCKAASDSFGHKWALTNPNINQQLTNDDYIVYTIGDKPTTIPQCGDPAYPGHPLLTQESCVGGWANVGQ